MKTLSKMALLPLVMLALALVSFSRAKADDIVDIASANPDFSTLVAAVKAADLVDTLKGDGPFTVFAPTNEAFDKLKKAIGEEKFNAILANKEILTKILTYHVIKGKVMAGDVLKLKSGTPVATVEGEKVVVKHSKKGVYVGKAKVVKTDIEASNGVIHVIDTVIVPPSIMAMKKSGGKMEKMDK